MVTIFGLKILKRNENVLRCQQILTKYGCNIKTRIGLHNSQGDICSEDGIILLEMCSNEKDNDNLRKELMKVENIVVKQMEL